MESITHEDASEGQVALERLPAEVLESIFMWLTPQSLLTIRRVSRLLYGIVKGNQSLHRDVYLLRMDRPETMGLDWEAEIQNLVKLEHIFDPRKDAEKEV
jgi:hypothetical protein